MEYQTLNKQKVSETSANGDKRVFDMQQLYSCCVVDLKDSQPPHVPAQLAGQAAGPHQPIKPPLWKPRDFLPHDMCLPSAGTFYPKFGLKTQVSGKVLLFVHTRDPDSAEKKNQQNRSQISETIRFSQLRCGVSLHGGGRSAMEAPSCCLAL